MSVHASAEHWKTFHIGNGNFTTPNKNAINTPSRGEGVTVLVALSSLDVHVD